MSERGYTVIGEEDGEYDIAFSSEDNDDFTCLCTFPGNDNGKLDNHRLRNLALLGAAVVLAVWENDQLNPVVAVDVGEYFVPLPTAVPQWIRDEIIRLLPEEE